MNQPDPDHSRRAKLRLDRRQLAHILDLPEGLRVVAVDSGNDPLAITLFVEGAHLEPVPDDTESPYLAGSLTTEVVVHDGRQFIRYGWASDTEKVPA